MKNIVCIVLILIGAIKTANCNGIVGDWVIGEGDVKTKFFEKRLQYTEDKKFIAYGDTVGEYNVVSDTIININANGNNKEMKYALKNNLLILKAGNGQEVKFLRTDKAYPSKKRMKSKALLSEWYSIASFESDNDTIKFESDNTLIRYKNKIEQENATYRIIDRNLIEFKIKDSISLSTLSDHNEYIEFVSPFTNNMQGYFKKVKGERTQNKKQAKKIIGKWYLKNDICEFKEDNSLLVNNKKVADYSTVSDSVMILNIGEKESVNWYYIKSDYLILQEDKLLDDGDKSILLNYSKVNQNILSNKQLVGEWEAINDELMGLKKDSILINYLISEDTIKVYKNGEVLYEKQYKADSHNISLIGRNNTMKVMALLKEDTLIFSNGTVLKKLDKPFERKISKIVYEKSLPELSIHKVLSDEIFTKWLLIVKDISEFSKIKRDENHWYIENDDLIEIKQYLLSDSVKKILGEYNILISQDKIEVNNKYVFPIFFVDSTIAFSGSEVEKITVSSNNRWSKRSGILLISLSNIGTKKFENLTAENIGKHLAICINGKLLSCPKINEKIPGGQLQLSFTAKEQFPWQETYEILLEL